MKTFITHHYGENDKEVMEILKNHYEWWREIDIYSFLNTDLYDIANEEGQLVGFFGMSHWNNQNNCIETTISYVYIKEEYRRKGLFNKIVRYVIDHNTGTKVFTIGATAENELANEIYSRKFKYLRYDEEQKGTWYIIKDRREYEKTKKQY